MCNLYSLRAPGRRILGRDFDFGRPRYKIAPGTHPPVVRLRDGEPVVLELKWGFRPAWMSREWMRAKKRQPPINARAETVDRRPMFRGAFHKQRCLIPADGFFEPNDHVKARGGKEFRFFQREDGAPFAFAGIWTAWHDDESTVENFCILTTEPEARVGAVHRRMPVILREDDYETWLNADAVDSKALLQPYRAAPLSGHIVSRDVYKLSPDDPDCTKPVE